MNFIELQKTIDALYYPVFLLEDTFPHVIRKKTERIFKFLSLVLFFISLILYAMDTFEIGTGLISAVIATKIYGLFDMVLLVWIIIFCLEAFYYSNCHRVPSADTTYIDFETAYAIHKTSAQNIAYTFFKTNIGKLVLLRGGVSINSIPETFSGQSTAVFQCNVAEGKITLAAFLCALSDYDIALSQILFSHGLQKKELVGIAEWIFYTINTDNIQEYWWSHENLGRIPGIGQGWSYGRAYTLEKYRRILPKILNTFEIYSSYGTRELLELETVLSKRREGNALLVGNDESGTLEIIAKLNALITQGRALAHLKSKYIVLLDNDALVSRNGSKSKFETEFLTILKEAQNAGNLILVIKDFAGFVHSASGLGADVSSLLEPYLSSPYLQIVGISDTERFHSSIEKNSALMQNFETIFIKEVDELNTIRVLENEIVRYERRGFFFTYTGLVAIAESAERYFPDGVMPDKAIDLLSELVPKLESKQIYVVNKKDVLEMVEVKTGIPIGEIQVEEKDKLLHLEDILHKRIIGQDEAISVISSAVRRARSGINNPNRPLGSFLFLGPTGVGKTETTKALADVFFGGDAHIMRLDMSEYSGADATSKLIGSYTSGQDGVLSSMLREHQYGVLLLDEFEKTTQEVMNLFLQILDEGFFSDMTGKKVMTRNIIIIATSNAGSDLIWGAVQSGQDVAASKDKILEALVTQGIFKPELLNRFDGVVVFHPLKNAELRIIAGLMLQKLHDRLALRGMNLVINEPLISFIVHHGTDPKFGARPMNRAIQEKVEQLIADKIIRGEITPGSAITLGEDDFVHNL